MNIGEHLNTLSNKEKAKWIHAHNELILAAGCNQSETYWESWLSQPHETTADEDFAEIGFESINNYQNDTTYFAYEDLEGRQLYISKYGNEYDSKGEMWSDDLVNNIRKIADKKRKEVWR